MLPCTWKLVTDGKADSIFPPRVGQCPLGAVGGSSDCTACTFQPGHCFGSQVHAANGNQPHAYIPNKCPSTDCHHGIKLYSFPRSSSLWLVFQYKGCELKTFNNDYTNTCCKINRSLCWIYGWRNWQYWFYQEAVQQFYSCSMHNNRYHCYHNFSNISLSESAEALANFTP